MAANINITLKRNNGTDYDVLYPKTIPAQVDGLLTDGRISIGLLPNAVFDSLFFFNTLGANADIRELGVLAVQNAASIGRSAIGYYWVATTTMTASSPTGSAQFGSPQVYATTSGISRSEEGLTTGTGVTLETSDWIVLTSVSGAGTVGSPYTFGYSVVNNTYEFATTAINGIVQLSNSTSTATTGNAVITNGVLNGLIGTTGTTIAAGNHLHTGVYQPIDGDLTAIAALAGTSGFLKKTAADTWSLDTATYLTTQSQDFGTVTVVDTDSGHTYASNGSATADANADTLTLVDGDGIDLDVSTTTDAIRIQHTDTSTLTGAQGSAGIASITVDGFGHVTAVTTATYNNYSLPLAANGTRGGLQIGFTSTETQRALELSSEKGFVTLPRQIPAVTFNGASSTAPSFYAPTGAGLTGSASQVKQRLNAVTGAAPTWIDSPNIYYDTTAGTTLGDIIFDVD
jgi:hypothetical protein